MGRSASHGCYSHKSLELDARSWHDPARLGRKFYEKGDQKMGIRLNFFSKMLLVLFMLGSLVWPALADDIADAISEGQKAYQAGDLATAKQALDTASQLIAQKNAEGYTKALPKPLAGWTAEDTDTMASGMMALGGSVASRRYKKGDEIEIEVSISGDNAILTQQMAVFSNPQMAGLMGKLVPINGQKAIQTKEGDVTMMVANRFIINVNGSGTAEDKLAYAKAVDVGALTKMK